MGRSLAGVVDEGSGGHVVLVTTVFVSDDDGREQEASVSEIRGLLRRYLNGKV